MSFLRRKRRVRHTDRNEGILQVISCRDFLERWTSQRYSEFSALGNGTTMSPREVGSMKSRVDSGSLHRVGYLCLNISTDVFPITCLLSISPLTQIQHGRRKDFSCNLDMLLVNVCMCVCLITNSLRPHGL